MAHPPLSGETVSLIAWLHQQALTGATAETILEGLCGQALALGLDLDRAVVGYLVLHPQFDGMTFTWTRDTGRAECTQLCQASKPCAAESLKSALDQC